jgi:hypothetical protein
VKLYGQPSNSADFLRSGSIWREPEDWMMGLTKKERTLATWWVALSRNGQNVSLPHQITGILLDTTGLGPSKGCLFLSYEFQGFAEYIDRRRDIESTVLK